MTKPRPYIEHIDGLRAIAVLSVLFFHAGLPQVSGGFIGVDVFFVISGFLMATILNNNPLDKNGLKQFFLSRFLRIVPAYAAVTLFIILLSYILLLPYNLEKIGYPLLTIPAFFTNVAFYKQTSYFSPDNAANPLLHTWSLAVEWQFYLVLPFILMFCRKKGISAKAIILLLFFSTLALSVVTLKYKAVLCFYMLPTRIWEFMCGAFVATVAIRAPRSRVVADALTLLGIVTILYCAATYDHKMPFPGLAALPPCLATALLIYCGAHSRLAANTLSSKPARFIGKTSYSIYLWHWPWVIFLNYVYEDTPFRASTLQFASVIVVLSLICGVASWKWVETPFRSAKARANIKPLLGAYLLFTMVCVISAFCILKSKGVPSRFPKEVYAISSQKYEMGEFRDCLGKPFTVEGACRMGDASAQPSFLLIGDSHAAALADGLTALAKEKHIAGILMATDACAPLFGVEGAYMPSRNRCAQMQQTIPQMIKDLKPKQIFITAAWSGYPKESVKLSVEKTFSFYKSLGVPVTVINDIPGARFDVPLAVGRNMAFGGHIRVNLTKEEYLTKNSAVNEILASGAASNGLQYVDIGSKACASGECITTIGDKSLYFDLAHLTPFGAQYMLKQVPDLFVNP